MKKIISSIAIVLLLMLTIVETFYIYKQSTTDIKQEIPKPIPKPLLEYSFENLKNTSFPINDIHLGIVVNKNSDFISQIFTFSVPKTPKNKEMDIVSGLINIPNKPGNYPIIVMLRGFVPDEIYEPGAGTKRVGEVLATNGYITLAPDFLGFGTSASSSADSFESRFQTYTTALTLLSSLDTLNKGLSSAYNGTITADENKIGIWGHSNGGHIALSTLAISGKAYPTVLWAPVTMSFPFSILYYTDEADDKGKVLRKILAQFEEVYDTEQFSPPNYYKWIQAPLEIEQGTADREIPVWLTDDAVTTFKNNGTNVTYHTYQGADHNLQPLWSEAVSNTIAFYKKYLFN
jgi:uncharacterized protein